MNPLGGHALAGSSICTTILTIRANTRDFSCITAICLSLATCVESCGESTFFTPLRSSHLISHITAPLLTASRHPNHPVGHAGPKDSRPCPVCRLSPACRAAPRQRDCLGVIDPWAILNHPKPIRRSPCKHRAPCLSACSDVKPREVYNLAAQSHVKVSFEMPS